MAQVRLHNSLKAMIELVTDNMLALARRGESERANEVRDTLLNTIFNLLDDNAKLLDEFIALREGNLNATDSSRDSASV